MSSVVLDIILSHIFVYMSMFTKQYVSVNMTRDTQINKGENP